MNARVLLITGGNPAAHPFDRTAPRIRAILGAGPFDLEEATVAADSSLARVEAPDGLADVDAVVLHGRFERGNEATEVGFERFVHGGKGLVVVHIASSSFPCSPRWRKLVGRVWEYGTSDHPTLGPFWVNVADHSHPVTAGMPDFEVESDERYQDLLVAPNATTHVLAIAALAGRTEPIAWVLTPPEGGRVFHLTLGHDYTTYENAAFKTLLNRGVAWAAGLPLSPEVAHAG